MIIRLYEEPIDTPGSLRVAATINTERLTMNDGPVPMLGVDGEPFEFTTDVENRDWASMMYVEVTDV